MSLPLPPGTLLRDRYRIREAIAEGGMGRTYVAEDLERFCEPCVIKEFLSGRGGSPVGVSPKERELFAREAALLYRLDHPQIPKFRGHFEEEGRLFLVQEYIDGGTLRELLQQRQQQGETLRESEVVDLLLHILPVLAYLHSQNIVHRDISPENIMVRSRDRLPMAIDFGASKELAALAGAANTVTVVGKLGYAPPEQLQTGQAFPNSDLYALAVTALELLTGQSPSDLYNPRELRWEWHDAVTVSPVLTNILDRMLARQPGQRYSSAAEVLTELAAWKAIRQQPKTVVATVAKTMAPPRTRYATAPKKAPAGFAWEWLSLPLVFVAAWGGASVLFTRLDTEPPPPPAPPPPLNVTRSLPIQNGRAIASDTIAPGQVVTYSWQGRKGQTLTATLEGTGLQMNLDYEDNKPIDSAAADVTNGYWRGALPASGTYFAILKVVAGEGARPYRLALTLTDPPPPAPPPPAPPSEPAPLPESVPLPPEPLPEKPPEPPPESLPEKPPEPPPEKPSETIEL